MKSKKSILVKIFGIVLILFGLYGTYSSLGILSSIFSTELTHTLKYRFDDLLRFTVGIPFIILGVYILCRWDSTLPIIKWAIVFYPISLLAFIIGTIFMSLGVLYSFFDKIVYITWWCPLDMRSFDEIDVYFIVIRMLWWGLYGVIGYKIYKELSKRISK